MKKILFISFCWLTFLTATANSVTVNITNRSNQSIQGATSQVKNGSFFVNDNGNVSPAPVAPGATATFKTSNAHVFCGTTGYVYYKTVVDGVTYTFGLSFDIPYWGDNEIIYSADKPFALRHISGGEGSDVVLNFELTGQLIPAQKPSPPIQQPNTGNGWVSGEIKWSYATGMPEGNIADAFAFEVIAPTKFYPTGPACITCTDGYYAAYKPIPNLQVRINKKARQQQPSNEMLQTSVYQPEVLEYTILNLPTNLPLQVKLNVTNALWVSNTQTPAQPSNYKYSKWFVYAGEKKINNQVYNYSVTGRWMNPDGTLAGNDNGQPAKLQKLLVKNNPLIIKTDGNRPGNNANTVTNSGIGNKTEIITKPMPGNENKNQSSPALYKPASAVKPTVKPAIRTIKTINQ